MYFENKKLINIFFAVSYIILFISTIIGGGYLIMTNGGSSEISQYIENYTLSIKQGMNLWGIVKSSCISYLIITMLIFISSFFKIGPAVSLFLIARKGFVDGFTLTAMASTYGLKCFHLYVPYLPQALLVIPILSFFSSVSAALSIVRKETERKSKIIYIIFSMIIITIFCICSFFEGLLTTTFVKWLAFKVT